MKKALVVVDFQNDFVNGSLGFPEASGLDPLIASKVRKAMTDGTDVIFTLDTHEKDYLETFEGRMLAVPDCLKGTEGWRIFGETGKEAEKARVHGAVFLEKKQFGSIELGRLLAEKGYDDVEFCGLVSNICVVSNVLIAKGAIPEAVLSVDSKATGSADKSDTDAALRIMKSCQVRVF